MTTIQRVIKYSGLNYFEVLKLPVDVFKMMVKDSVTADLQQSEKGKEILDNYYSYKKTELDETDIAELKKALF